MKANENEILTIAGKLVRVEYCTNEAGCCDKCCLIDRSSARGCFAMDKSGVTACFHYDDADNAQFAYFVHAEESANKTQTDANKNEPTREQKADFLQTNDADKAAEAAARREFPYEGGTKGDICEASIPIFCKGFKAGIAYERERLMNGAVECNVIWYDGRLLDLTQEQLDAALDKIGAGVDARVSVIIIKKEK